MRRNSNNFVYRMVLLFFLSALLLTGCGKEEQQKYTIDLFAMDTYMTFTAYGNKAIPSFAMESFEGELTAGEFPAEADLVEAALTKVRERIMELEGLWSVTEEESEIYQVNHSNGQWTAVSGETAELIAFALEMAEKTKGALEPTIYPVLEAWGFTTEENHVPAEEEIVRLLEKVDYEKVTIDGARIALEDGMMLDLGAVAKGYAGDLAVEILRGYGITSALLDIGGNIQALGAKPDGSSWRVGIRSPFGGGTIGVLEISDTAVVTSGCYERYFIGEDGKQYGHIIDSSTGHPVENELASATIIAKEGRLCDALSTSMFVMGLEGAADYWRSDSEFEMILVTKDGKVYLTEGIQERFTLSSAFHEMEVCIISHDKKE